jgi:hypothetical protein
MKYIERTFTERVGGGFFVDFLILKDGRCVGINDECIALYDSYEHFCGDGPFENIQFIDILKEKAND